MKKICFGCMHMIPEEARVCPYCRFSSEYYEKEPFFLDCGTMLQNRYLVGKALGTGGFGISYIGYDYELNRIVAIKEYMPGEFATRVSGERKATVFSGVSKQQFVRGKEEFLAEAEKLAELRSEPEIVHVFNYFEENDTAYIVMEYLDGETLKARLVRERLLPVEDALNIITEVLRGLIKVHNKGMLHRDISPDNIFILIDKENQTDLGIKLFDFGTARTVSSGRTRSLTVEFKPGYSPPEQYCSHGKQGTWSDVYATAATLYRMLTGTVPQVSMERTVKDNLEMPSKKGIRISPSLENALMNALNTDVEYRTKTAEVFLNQLESESTKRIKPRGRKEDFGKWPLGIKIILGSMAALLLGFGVLLGTDAISFEKASFEISSIPDGMVKVPNFLNLSYVDAEETASDSAITLKIADKEYSNTVPISRILAQSAPPGSLIEKGNEVRIVLSAGIEQTYAPYIVGYTRERAENELLEKGFRVTFEEIPSYVAPGCVCSQEPQADSKVNTGDTIHVLLSKGVNKIMGGDDIPLLIGKSWDEALLLAEKRGFYIRRSDTIIDESDEGTILACDVVSDDNGNNICEVSVSRGPERTLMPDVTGGSMEVAEKLMNEAGLGCAFEYEKSEAVESGYVMRQELVAGSRIPRGTEVKITVSSGMPETETEAETESLIRPVVRPTETPQPIQIPETAGERPTIMDNNG